MNSEVKARLGTSWNREKKIDLCRGGLQNEIFHFVGPPGPEGRDIFYLFYILIIFEIKYNKDEI